MVKFRDLLRSQTVIDTLLVISANGLSSAMGFIFIFIIARRLGPVNFGVYSTLVTFATFLSAVVDLGISQSLVKFVSETSDLRGKKVWISTGLAAVASFASFFGILSYLGYELWLRNIWHHNEHYGVLVALTIIVVTISIYFLGLFQSIKQFIQRSVFDVSFSVFRLLLVGVLLLTRTMDVSWALISIITAYLLAISWGWQLARVYLNRRSIQLSVLPRILGFSRWIAGINFLANLYGRLDVLMLAWLTNAYLTGIYAAAARFITIFPLVTSSFSAVVAPRFAGFRSNEELKPYLIKSTLISISLALGLGGMVLVASPLILIPYSRAFQDSVGVFKFLVLANIPLVLSIPITNTIIYFYKYPQTITTITLIQVIALIMLNLWLIPSKQAYGPVISLFVCNLLGLALQLMCLVYLLNKRVKL